MPTFVVNVRVRDRKLLLADPLFLYVGRGCAGWAGSAWGNPFVPGMYWDRAIDLLHAAGARLRRGNSRRLTVEDCLRCYSGWLSAQPELAVKIPELRGRTLGCWCGDWDGVSEPAPECHAVLLARLAEGGV